MYSILIHFPFNKTKMLLQIQNHKKSLQIPFNPNMQFSNLENS